MSLRFVFILKALTLINLVTAKKHENLNRMQYRTIEKYMDVNADPCTDFYQYACGNWESVHSDASYTDTFEFLDYQIDEQYESILKSRQKTANRQKHFVRQILLYYKSCRLVEEFQLSNYIEWMQENENIEWPGVEGTIENNTYDWLHMLATLRKYGLNGIFLSESILQKSDESRHLLLDIDRPAKGDEFQRLKYWQFQNVLEYFGINKRRKQKQLWKVFEAFENNILELYDIEDDEGFQEIKLSDVRMPQIKRYLQIVFEGNGLEREMLLTISNRPYFEALFRLLENYDEEFICRYLMIRFLWYLNYNGPTEFKDIACISNVRQQMPMAMAWLYEEHNPNIVRESKTVENTFENLRNHFLNLLTENRNNFNNNVLNFLKEKLKSMQFKVGNLPRNSTTETVEQFYYDLTLNGNDFYGNHLRLLRFNSRKYHNRLNTILPSDVKDFYYLEDTGMSASSTPFFLQRNNLVIMPITLLHLPLYHPQLHGIFKYSLVGFLLAHEITHGFDESGLDYDQYGNMQEISDSIKYNKKFDRNFDCLLAKNPRVIDEKIADVSGLRLAFETFFSNISTSEYAITFPWSSNMPQAQLFFHNFALFFCGAISNDETLANSSHGTWRSRLHDTVSQFSKFGQAFKCAVGSAMNPTRKCQLWR